MDKRIPARTLVVVPYPQMIRNLFKPMGSDAATRVHAAVGIAGEAAELIIASSIENIVEELGDIEFYVEAYYQALGGRRTALADELSLQTGDPSGNQVLGTVTIAIAATAGALLDLTKKSWVYEKPFDANAERAVRYELLRLEVMMGQLREMIGVRQVDVLGANQGKLGKRYPDGVYTDKAAQERIDKPEGE
ncbi:putative nucleotide pyrophosphohydrolase [Xanthomonas phage vB_Xar_IVIA-DoCa5]|uniref:Nucleotide pyrophosphohydrolase n=1 Tax=Xanthomonas phage vB_Xar_IVIA-DoCa5 TaxID=2975532 RepID=A0A9X9JPP6_9CAUD|nr:putative nucleotide pyrophosphohydrolase [Xanthomonas phage vB_Xar_IVIA-DoCa5]UYA98735.1 putative nucleotide pyrophosphohydrolase [Xanthomonas phage vB_Xar_IVIA-DoCa5]